MTEAQEGTEHTQQAPGDLEGLKAVDWAFLVVLSRNQGGAVPLSEGQEALLDDWVAERLSTGDAQLAAALTKGSTLAAERVLERRLVETAQASSHVPPELCARVLASSRPIAAEKKRIPQSRLPSFVGFRWLMAGGAIAATFLVAVLGFQNWQQRARSEHVSIAMVTVGERLLMGDSPPVLTRGIRPPPAVEPPSGAFIDVNVSTMVLQRAITNEVGAQLLADLSLPNITDLRNVQILVDSMVTKKLVDEWGGRPTVPLRIYDLTDISNIELRKKIKVTMSNIRILLLTPRP